MTTKSSVTRRTLLKSAGAAALAAPLYSKSALASSGEVNILMWSDYLPPSFLEAFEAETGIKVTYDVFDSNDVLEAKLLSGKTGYDLVVPSVTFLARQIQAGVFQELDRTKLPNHKNLDPAMMDKLSSLDPENAYAIYNAIPTIARKSVNLAVFFIYSQKLAQIFVYFVRTMSPLALYASSSESLKSIL